MAVGSSSQDCEGGEVVVGCGKYFFIVGISKFRTIAKIKNKISKIRGDLLHLSSNKLFPLQVIDVVMKEQDA